LNLVNLVSSLCVLQFFPINSLIFIHFSSNFHPVLPYQTQVSLVPSGLQRLEEWPTQVAGHAPPGTGTGASPGAGKARLERQWMALGVVSGDF
jgi:hypothetical protein